MAPRTYIGTVTFGRDRPGIGNLAIATASTAKTAAATATFFVRMTQVNRSNPNNKLSRREWLQKVSAGSLYLALAELAMPGSWAARPAAQGSRFVQQSPFSPDDEAFLEELEKANFLYFWEQANPETGMVRDRASVRNPDSSVLSSIAATGFGLTALCIGEKRGLTSYNAARGRKLTTLAFS